jgi:hypothetical protein
MDSTTTATPTPFAPPGVAAMMNAPDDETAGFEAPQPDMGSIIAQHQVAAGQVNNGGAKAWAENAVAGVQAALAGFGAAGKVPAGAGALYGVGAAARQAQENRQAQAQQKTQNAQRQQQIDLEKTRTENEKTQQDRTYGLQLAENARQQAMSVREMAEHDKRMREFDDAHNRNNFNSMKDEVDFRENQLDREATLQSLGGKVMEIAGVETPGFDDLGQLEQFANKNNLASQAHSNGYRARPIFGADQKYHLWEVPDSGPEWVTVKDPAGKPTKIFGDPLSVLNYQEKVAQIHEANARTSLTYAEAKKDMDQRSEDGTVKAARAELSKVDGDISKLSPGSRVALRGDAQKQYGMAWNVYQAAQRDMQRDSDYQALPIDAKGNPDTNSPEYQKLAAKYHVDEAQEQLGDVYNELRQLGVGYRPPGATPPATVAPAAQAPQPGTPAAEAARTLAAQQQRKTEQQQREMEQADEQLVSTYDKPLPGLSQEANEIRTTLKANKNWSTQQKAEYIRGVTGQQAGAGTAQANAPARPANVPQNYVFNANGPKGAGWYNPGAQNPQ